MRSSLNLASQGLLRQGVGRAINIASLGHIRRTDVGGGGSGVGRLGGYFSRDVGSKTWPDFFGDLEAETRDEIERVTAETPSKVIRAVTDAAASLSVERDDEPVGVRKYQSIKGEIAALATEIAGPVESYDIDAIIRHFEILRDIEMWRQEEEDIAILLLSL